MPIDVDFFVLFSSGRDRFQDRRGGSGGNETAAATQLFRLGNEDERGTSPRRSVVLHDLSTVTYLRNSFMVDNCGVVSFVVQYLKVEVQEKRRALNSVLDNYDALCKRVEQQGPDFLRPRGSPDSSSQQSLVGGALQHILRTASSMVDNT